MKSNIDSTQRKTIIKYSVYALIFIVFLSLYSGSDIRSAGTPLFSFKYLTSSLPGFIGLILLGCLYFLPSIVGRKKHNKNAILTLNLLLGWTIIGWIVALIWATTKDTEVFEEEEEEYPDTAEELLKFARLRDGGIITEEEFETRKRKLLEN